MSTEGIHMNMWAATDNIHVHSSSSSAFQDVDILFRDRPLDF